MKIAYKTDSVGFVSDIRFVPDEYKAAIDELIIEGDVLPKPEDLHSIQALKDIRNLEVKAEAARRINDILPDWKARRHRDQVELGVTTTLTDYVARQQKCQAIRDTSNKIETEIQALTDPAAVENFDVANHSAWPM